MTSDAIATFNFDLTYVSYLKLYDSTDTLIDTLATTITDNEFTATLPILTNGTYYFTFSVTNVYNEVLEVTDKEVWKFEIKEGVYDATIYNNSQYLIA